MTNAITVLLADLAALESELAAVAWNGLSPSEDLALRTALIPLRTALKIAAANASNARDDVFKIMIDRQLEERA